MSTLRILAPSSEASSHSQKLGTGLDVLLVWFMVAIPLFLPAPNTFHLEKTWELGPAEGWREEKKFVQNWYTFLETTVGKSEGRFASKQEEQKRTHNSFPARAVTKEMSPWPQIIVPIEHTASRKQVILHTMQHLSSKHYVVIGSYVPETRCGCSFGSNSESVRLLGFASSCCKPGSLPDHVR